LAALEHSRQEGPDGAVHGLHVEVEGEVPVFLGALEHRAVMDKARAVEKDIDGPDARGESLHGRGGAYVERQQIAGEPFQFGWIKVGRHYMATFARESLRRGAADAGPGGSDQSSFIL